MNQTYPLVPLGKLLIRKKEEINIQELDTYIRITIRMNGQGIVIRDHVSGSEIGTKNQFVIKAGQLVLSKIDARNGAFGILKNDCNNAIITGNFWAFDVNHDLLDIRYFDYLTKTHLFIDFCIRASDGTTNRLYLQEPIFLSMKIPLPSLLEQRRIVARVEEIVGKVQEVRSLRQKALKQTEVLQVVESTKLFSNIPTNGQLADVLYGKPRNGWSARCNNMPGGIAVLSLGAVTGFSYREKEFKRTSELVSHDANYWLKPGDLLITRSNTPELVGHAAIYNGSPFPCIYPDLMMRLDVNESKVDKKFVHRWLTCTPVRDYIKSKAKGTSPTMKKISQEIVMSIPFPCNLSLPEQRRVVAYLDELQTKIDTMKQLRKLVMKELDALLPSILDKAFKGEL